MHVHVHMRISNGTLGYTDLSFIHAQSDATSDTQGEKERMISVSTIAT